MSEPFEFFSEAYWVSIAQGQGIASQNSELQVPLELGHYVHGWQEQYPYENMGSIEHDANIRVDNAPSQSPRNVDLDGNMTDPVAAPISPTLRSEEVMQEPLHTTDGNHDLPGHSMHSYSRVNKEHRHHISLDHIKDLSLGDRNGTHQCMYKRGRGICRRSFHSRDDAVRHVIEVHLKNIRFICSCGRTFTKKTYAEKHKMEAEATPDN
ncbi:hypothetical protein M422DRAFT_239803 [Sphaerobolus stellatus SS14]|nr:hypothetical protein M422DRAFT_239789 [Sphaerobolus stellatus SS14]KIJ55173.1 hypothetical protein M422DRAFT_239800 [Sphaerobolus stellatus SS14]KIJ55176.1 hypothetical protein M422DRAFT_239803 [Sphaerobolus stellatus SS14]